MIRDGIKSTRKVGICPEEEWPYNEETLYAEPPETCYQSAKKLVLMEYRRVDNTAMDSLLAALTIGPVVGGFTVFQSFESDYVQSTGVAPMPDLTLEMAVGGHAIVVAGHDLDKQVLLVRNSWGTGWGMDGYFTVPLLYFMNGSLADDFWLMQKIT
jgi:C1A family cysteine protease